MKSWNTQSWRGQPIVLHRQGECRRHAIWACILGQAKHPPKPGIRCQHYSWKTGGPGSDEPERQQRALSDRRPAGRRTRKRNSDRKGTQEMLCSRHLKAAAMQAWSRRGDTGQLTPLLLCMLSTEELRRHALRYFLAASEPGVGKIRVLLAALSKRGGVPQQWG